KKTGTKYYITDLRKGYAADLSGLQIGDEVVLFNNKPIPDQLKKFLPRYTAQYSEEMFQYALDMLFAGAHDTPRKITINHKGRNKNFQPDQKEIKVLKELLDHKILRDNTAY